MTAIPQRILAYLSASPSATAGELARSLGCTAANVRYHLDDLLDRGMVTVERSQPSGQRGRPHLVYRLSDKNREHNLVDLSAALLTIVVEEPQPGLAGERLERLAAEIAGPLPDRGKQISLQLTALVRRLNELFYHARWEAWAGGPRVYLTNCPYAALLPQHKKTLCEMDRQVISCLAGKQVSRVSPLAVPPCIFSIKP
ncbi:MAG TPA: helix-turn-helix domain-containing protein [Anaerolineaceae bacterium]